jgi:hypothetical protein
MNKNSPQISRIFRASNHADGLGIPAGILDFHDTEMILDSEWVEFNWKTVQLAGYWRIFPDLFQNSK